MDKVLKAKTRSTIISYNSCTPVWNIREPTELPGDIMVRIKSVLEALKECTEKIQISLMMPMIFTESTTVCAKLDNTQYQDCAKLLRECILEMKKHPNPSESMRDNIRLSRVIDAFQNNSPILDIIGHLFPHHNIDFTSTLSAWSIIYDLTKARMYKDPKKELELERYLHTVYWENTEFNDYYKKFLMKTIKGRLKLQWRIAAKEAIVTQIENEIALDKMRRQNQFHLVEKKMAKQLQETQKSCQNKTKELDEELHRTKDSYNKAVKDNFKTEMDVRAERNKLMIQFQALLRRYDSVMLEKKKTVLFLTEKLNFVQEEFDVFYQFYLTKEEVHNEIQKKKDEEFAARVEFFTQTRAAKIIQKAWKRYIKIVRKEKAQELKKKKK